jgi:signal transduction histidine kinase
MRVAGRGSALLWLALLLAACIAWLGVMQWRWVREASEAEQARMQSLLDARVAQFTQEFDRRITNLYAQFVLVPNEARPASLSERAAEWLAKENAPALVSEIFAVRGRPGTPLRLQRFDEATSAFEDSAWPARLEGLRERLTRGQPAAGARPAVWRVGPRIDHEIPAVVVARPVLHLGTPATGGGDAERDVLLVVAVLDPLVIERTVLPDLVGRYFPDEPGFSYRVLVRDPTDAPVFVSPAGSDLAAFARPDASAHMLRVRNDFFDRLQADRVRVVNIGPEATPDLARGGGAGAPPHGPPPPDGPPRREGQGRMQVFLSQGFVSGETVIVVPEFGPQAARWEVAVVHREGSVAAAVARSRRWNLGLSLGVLALLAASVALALVASQRAQRLARERVEFVAGVSHELRTPLAVIRSAAENLADGVVDERTQVQRYGTLIAGEGRKLSGMVDQVLQFAGLEAGHPLRAVPLPVADLVDAAVAAVDPVLAEHGVEVDRRLAPGLPPVLGEHDAIVRALANLLSNAAKHGGPRGPVTVSVSAASPGDRVRIAVEDRGPGIPAHEQKRVFEPFFRGAAALASQVHGSGLGLSLVRRIAEQHGGEVELSSRVGHGSTFVLVLPAARGGAAAGAMAGDTAVAGPARHA